MTSTIRTTKTILLLLGAAILAPPVQAQITPPKEGVPMPPGYYQRMSEDRGAFRFKRAWKAETERVRRARLHAAREGVLSLGAGQPGTKIQGTKSIPVLTGTYANVNPVYTDAQLQAQLFDGPNSTGTITDYYLEVSYGAFTMTGDVLGAQGGGHFVVSQNDTYYEGGCNGLCGSAKTGEYLKELLDGADSWVDFSLYDNDGPDGLPNSGDDDGYVDFVAFVHPETGGECGNSNMWSHRWVYEGWWPSAYTTNDAAAGGGSIRVSDYTIQPLRSCSGGVIEIGVYAHEFGHAFGLPDLYDTDDSSAGIGTWCLMSSGSWGGDFQHPETPSHMSAWCKEQLGWAKIIELCQGRTGMELYSAADDSAAVVKIYPHGVRDNEYFLLENRFVKGFDFWLKASGIAVWHIDNDIPNNNNENHKLVDLEEADGQDRLDLNLSYGDGGDLYPGIFNRQLFDNTTYPNSKDYNGVATGVSLSNISGADPRIFDIAMTECRLDASDVLVNDSSWGNNNGVLDETERSHLRVGLVNDFTGDVTGVSGTLTSLTAGVNVLQGTDTFGTVACGAVSYGGTEYEIETTGSVTAGNTVDFLIALVGDAGYTAQDTVTAVIGRYVLLVEDDGTAANSSYYLNALTALGYTSIHHNTTADGLPGLGLLQSAFAVVWYTGEESANVLTAEEQVLLQAYLDNGGLLALIGQDLGWDLSAQGTPMDTLFYQDYLHAQFLTDDVGDNSITGVSGDPIGDGLSFSTVGGGGAQNATRSSEIAPLGGAAAVFEYAPGTVAAIRYAGTHRLVYLAFNFEAIRNSGDRSTVMGSILNWLTPDDLTPPTVSLLSPAGGDTLNSCADTLITWTAGDNIGVTEVDLYYSDDGGVSYPHLIAGGLANSGSHLWTHPTLQGSSYRVKVAARDAGGLQAVDAGTDFLFMPATPPVPRILEPNGGENFGIFSSVLLHWTSVDSCTPIDSTQIQVSYDGGSAWAALTTVIGPATTYVWSIPDSVTDSALVRVDLFGAGGLSDTDFTDAVFSISSSVVSAPDRSPVFTRPTLLQNHPNPMAASHTVFSFYLDEAAPVSLQVFDIMGRRVATVVDQTLPRGFHERSWNGLSDGGLSVGRGLYFYVLETLGTRQTRKLLKLR